MKVVAARTAIDAATVQRRPRSAEYLGGCLTLLGTAFLAVFAFGTFRALPEVLQSATKVAFGVGLGIYIWSWLLGGIGLIAGKAWGWWIAGVALCIESLRRLQAFVGALLLGFNTTALEPATTGFAFFVLTGVVVLWQSPSLRTWCAIRTATPRATLLAVLFGVAALGIFNTLLIWLVNRT